MQTPMKAQERWGAAVALLSLDVVVPFYAHLGLQIVESKSFLQALRETILSNRRTFEGDQSHIPDLKGAILNTLTHHFGHETASTFEDWVNNVFVYTGQDFAPLSKWYMLLALARTDSQRWNALGLPPTLAKEAHTRLDEVLNRSELHALADQIEKRPLSNWDLEMYALHGFDDDENDPYNWVLETVKKRRFGGYLGWLVASLSDEQRSRFVDNANTLRMQTETTRNFPPFTDPKEFVRQDADYTPWTVRDT